MATRAVVTTMESKKSFFMVAAKPPASGEVARHLIEACTSPLAARLRMFTLPAWMNTDHDLRLLRLHPADNVLTALVPLAAGERFIVNGVETTIAGPISLGHKLAARPIAAGEKIIKYGAPIGSATRDIACGEHVHTHNLKSDYLPTFLHEDQGRYFGTTPTTS